MSKKRNKNLFAIFMLSFVFVIIVSFNKTKVEAFSQNKKVKNKSEVPKYENIIYDDETSLYVYTNFGLLKINKDLEGESSLLTKKGMSFKYNYNNGLKKIKFEDIKDSNLKYKNNKLYVNDVFICDLSSYEKRNNKFYKDHKKYLKKPIYYNVSKAILKNKSLYSIEISTSVDIPAPYTPRFVEFYIGKNKEFEKLAIDNSFKQRDLYEEEGRYILTGGKQYNQDFVFGNVFVLDDDKVVDLRKTMKLMGSENMWETIEFRGIIDDNIILKKSHDNDDEKKEYYLIDKNYKAKKWKLKDIKNMYKSKEGKIYIINSDADEIRILNEDKVRKLFDKDYINYKISD
ncbi:MAG: hypothetical protein N4A54_01980 [Peptostreptococcaceae bacterium]|jgi:hypothetical protein|nr:hypothetical protein [Peptostreptococcaceae bacterium]